MFSFLPISTSITKSWQVFLIDVVTSWWPAASQLCGYQAHWSETHSPILNRTPSDQQDALEIRCTTWRVP